MKSLSRAHALVLAVAERAPNEACPQGAGAETDADALDQHSSVTIEEHSLYEKLKVDDAASTLLIFLAEHWQLSSSVRTVKSQVVCRLVCSTSPFRVLAREMLTERAGQNSALALLINRRLEQSATGTVIDKYPFLQSPLERELYPRDASLVLNALSVADWSASSLAVQMMLQSDSDPRGCRPQGVADALCQPNRQGRTGGFFSDYIGKTLAAIHVLRSEIRFFCGDEYPTTGIDFSFHICTEKLNGMFVVSETFRRIFEANAKVLVLPTIIYTFRWHLWKILASDSDSGDLVNDVLYLLACIGTCTAHVHTHAPRIATHDVVL